MLSLTTAFWILVLLLAVIGMQRGWTREALVTASVVLALFTINQFGGTLFGLVGWDNTGIPTVEVRRLQFYALSFAFLLIVFFGYQGPTLASSRISDKLRIRDNFQDKLLGFIVGGVNGYLIVGTIWSFLEYRLVSASNWVQYGPEVSYPFPPEIITRPNLATTALLEYLPVPILTASPFILPILLVVVFLFIIIVLL